MIETADRIVVDASALGSLLFREAEASKVERAIAGHLCVAPSLIDYEIGSIYLHKLRQQPKLRDELARCYQVYCDLDIERVDVPVKLVVKTAEKHHLSIYDASYLWLARELQLELVTLDKKLKAACS